MKKLGIFLISIGIIGLIYFFQMDTSVKVNYSKGNSLGFPERVNNIGLMNEKQNYIIISGILLFSGLLLSLFGNKQRVENKINTENFNKTNIDHNLSETAYYCQKCGEELFLEMNEIENKKFLCPKCNSENIII